MKKYPFYSTEKLMLLGIAGIALFDYPSNACVLIRIFFACIVWFCFFSSPKEE
jgi:hypothetical protein